MKTRAFSGVVVLCAYGALASACSSDGAQATAADHGKVLVADPKLSSSSLNFAACTTCHRFEAGDKPTQIVSGVNLAGATLRPTFWAGQEYDLLAAINLCRYFFMASSTPWKADDDNAKAVYAYLTSLEGKAKPEDKVAQRFTVVQDIQDLPAGSSAKGAEIFQRACQTCHGSAHKGEGRPRPSMPILPDETVEAHEYLKSRDATRLVFIEKTRHGGFLGYGGMMPPFSKESLSDQDLGALLAYLGLY